MSSWQPDYEISISDSEDEDDNPKTYDGREALIFVVDSNLYNEPERLKSALDIIRSAFLSGLLINDKDLMALIFANTDCSPDPFEPNCLENIVMPENCAVFLPPRQLTTPIVEHYLRFVESAPNEFGEMFGVCANDGCGNFSHMLRLCLDLVQHSKYTVGETSIIYLTDRDTPHPPQSQNFTYAIQKAADFAAKDVDFHVIPMVNEFNYNVFYKEFMSLVRNMDMDAFEEGNPEQLREILTNRKVKQHFVRRSLGHFKLSLGPDLALSAQYFNYFQKAKAPNKVLLQRTDNALVRRHRVTLVCKQNPQTEEYDEGRNVNITDAWYEINLGSEAIRLSYAQVNRVRNLHAPSMMLLGFKPRAALSKSIYCKPSNFMYPDDSHIVGSKRLFRALWERCTARDKIAVCLFMPKRKSMPRYVVLVPVSKEQTDEQSDYSLIANDGFKMIYLPASTYIRGLDLADWNSIENHASDEAVDVCEKLVRKFRLDYKPSALCDPDLDQLQSKLLALAFGVTVETVGSQYFPNAEQQDQRIAKLIPKFEEIFGADAEAAKKRAAPKGESNAAKVPKLSADNINDKDFVMNMVANKSLGSCNKDQLLQILNDHFDVKMPKSSKKQELLDRIYES